jgi:hypothetical protein
VKDSDMLLAAVSAGDSADTTISAALDALQEDARCDLIGAVLCVARAWKAGCDARDLTRATQAVSEGAPHRAAILSAIAACAWPDFPTQMTIVVMEGDSPPCFPDIPTPSRGDWFGPCTATVGAKWVLAHLDEAIAAGPGGRRKRKSRRAER